MWLTRSALCGHEALSGAVRCPSGDSAAGVLRAVRRPAGRTAPCHGNRVTRRPGSRQIDGEAFQILQLAVAERAFVGGAQHHVRRPAGLQRLLPARPVQAPAVAGVQAGETVDGFGGREVVANGAVVVEGGVRVLTPTLAWSGAASRAETSAAAIQPSLTRMREIRAF
jgi:hypothetical protein